MTEINNKHLHDLYNGSEVITNAGFTMQSNYIVPLLTRMNKEGIINQSACYVLQTILTHKHGKNNPFPKFETMAEVLGVTVDAIKKGVKSIRNAGILNVKKRFNANAQHASNEYDFTPFFAILEKFIIEFVEKKNVTVKISELMNVVVSKVTKKEKTASAEEGSRLDNLPKVETVIEHVAEPVEEPKQAPSEPVQEAPQGVSETVNTKLPEMLLKACEVYKLDAEGMNTVLSTYAIYGGQVSDAIFLEKLHVSITQKNFNSYYMKCISNAYTNNEQPKQAPNQPAPKAIHSGGKVELKPDWFDNRNNHTEKSMEEQIAEMGKEELLALEVKNNVLLESIPNNESLLKNKELINKRKLELSI